MSASGGSGKLRGFGPDRLVVPAEGGGDEPGFVTRGYLRPAARSSFFPLTHAHTNACTNADRLTGDALQTLMRHKAYSTTQRYINAPRQIDEAVEKLYVPTFPETDGE